jgi:hypothetical protein
LSEGEEILFEYASCISCGCYVGGQFDRRTICVRCANDQYGPGEPAMEFTESPQGYEARERWARNYDALNGAPEGDWDR